MPMNLLPRSIERGSVTLFSAGVVLIFLKFKGTQKEPRSLYVLLVKRAVT